MLKRGTFSHRIPAHFEQDKILQSLGQSCDIQVTNDGATILKSISIDNPAAKVLVGTIKITISCCKIECSIRVKIFASC